MHFIQQGLSLFTTYFMALEYFPVTDINNHIHNHSGGFMTYEFFAEKARLDRRTDRQLVI